MNRDIFDYEDNIFEEDTAEDAEEYCDIFTCSECQTVHNDVNKTIVSNGDEICRECFEEYYFKCDDCEGIYLKVDVDSHATVNGSTVCQQCYDDNYFKCNDCEEIRHNESNYYITSDKTVICQECCDADYVTCSDCGDVVHAQETHSTNGDVICDRCYDNNYFTCEDCGDINPSDTSVLVYGYRGEHYVCDSCYCDNYFTCDSCGGIHPIDTSYSVNGGDALVCGGCYDNDYFTCDNCGDIYHIDDSCSDDDGTFCTNCWEDNKNKVIHDYSYKPETIFNGEDDIYMGIELEVEAPSDLYDSDLQDTAQRLLNISNLIYMKHDGSLSNGFEIVSHPATLDYHTDTMGWNDIINSLLDEKYRSHDPESCGLHVHVGRKELGDTRDEIDETITNIIYLHEKFWGEIVKFSRRKGDKINRWAGSHFCDTDAIDNMLKDDIKRVGCGNIGSRYKAVNVVPRYTVEFRIFRGTLKYSTFLATLQFVRELVNIAIEHTFEDLKLLNWETFTKMFLGKYKELDEYLAERKLINAENAAKTLPITDTLPINLRSEGTILSTDSLTLEVFTVGEDDRDDDFYDEGF